MMMGRGNEDSKVVSKNLPRTSVARQALYASNAPWQASLS